MSQGNQFVSFQSVCEVSVAGVFQEKEVTTVALAVGGSVAEAAGGWRRSDRAGFRDREHGLRGWGV